MFTYLHIHRSLKKKKLWKSGKRRDREREYVKELQFYNLGLFGAFTRTIIRLPGLPTLHCFYITLSFLKSNSCEEFQLHTYITPSALNFLNYKLECIENLGTVTILSLSIFVPFIFGTKQNDAKQQLLLTECPEFHGRRLVFRLLIKISFF